MKVTINGIDVDYDSKERQVLYKCLDCDEVDYTGAPKENNLTLDDLNATLKISGQGLEHANLGRQERITLLQLRRNLRHVKKHYRKTEFDPRDREE